MDSPHRQRLRELEPAEDYKIQELELLRSDHDRSAIRDLVKNARDYLWRNAHVCRATAPNSNVFFYQTEIHPKLNKYVEIFFRFSEDDVSIIPFEISLEDPQ